MNNRNWKLNWSTNLFFVVYIACLLCQDIIVAENFHRCVLGITWRATNYITNITPRCDDEIITFTAVSSPPKSLVCKSRFFAQISAAHYWPSCANSVFVRSCEGRQSFRNNNILMRYFRNALAKNSTYRRNWLFNIQQIKKSHIL